MEPEEALQKLYDRIPKVKCPPECTDCCGPIWMSNLELTRLPPRVKAREHGVWCPYMKKGEGCTVYEKRPLICRLYGTTETLALTCTFRPWIEKRLTEAETKQIIAEYIEIFQGKFVFMGDVKDLKKKVMDAYMPRGRRRR